MYVIFFVALRAGLHVTNARNRTFICDIYRCRKLLATAEAACEKKLLEG